MQLQELLDKRGGNVHTILTIMIQRKMRQLPIAKDGKILAVLSLAVAYQHVESLTMELH